MDYEGTKSRMRLKKVKFKCVVSCKSQESKERDSFLELLRVFCKEINVMEVFDYDKEIWTLLWPKSQKKGY